MYNHSAKSLKLDQTAGFIHFNADVFGFLLSVIEYFILISFVSFALSLILGAHACMLGLTWRALTLHDIHYLKTLFLHFISQVNLYLWFGMLDFKQQFCCFYFRSNIYVLLEPLSEPETSCFMFHVFICCTVRQLTLS